MSQGRLNGAASTPVFVLLARWMAVWSLPQRELALPKRGSVKFKVSEADTDSHKIA